MRQKMKEDVPSLHVSHGIPGYHLTTDPPPNGAAYADEGDANLLLSFHVCLTRKHAIPYPALPYHTLP